MKQYMQPHTRYIGLFLLVLTLGWFWQPANAAAEDVVLNPGYITGSLKIGDLKFSSVNIQASSGSNTSSTSSIGNSYTLTVNTPQTGSYNYKVTCYLYANNNTINYHFKERYVTVSAGQTSTVDYSFTPGFINGSITNTGSATLNGGSIRAYPFYKEGECSTNSYISFGADGKFSLPIQPSNNVEIRGTANYRDGQQIDIRGTVSVTENGITTINWNHNIDARPAPVVRTGSLTGEININHIGNIGFENIFNFLRDGAWQSNILDKWGQGTYLLSNLKVGRYSNIGGRLYAFDKNRHVDTDLIYPKDYFYRYVDITDGGFTVYDITASVAFITGNVTIDNNKPKPYLIWPYSVSINGTSSGSSSDRIDRSTNKYRLIVTDGNWGSSITTNVYFYNRNDLSGYMSSSLYYSEYPNEQTYDSYTLAGGETATHDINLETGSVTLVNFTVLGGDTLTDPILNGICEKNDEYGNLLTRSYFYASGHPDQDKVSFVATPGIYAVTARAIVGGSNVTFGKMKIEVLPGTDVVIDIGGLTLSMDGPAPEFYTSDSTVTVSGKVTDVKGVADVSVNGTSVTLTSTNNSDDPNEMYFSTEIVLDYGPNSIQTIATSTDGRNSSDTRTIYRDSGPPTLEWTPAGGSMTSEDSVTVKGTASDDNEITKVTVNGDSVLFSPTNNPEDPNEVEFSATVHLNDGPNQIVVATQDNCKRTTTQTHTVSKVQNSPPTANAGPDQTVSAGPDCETFVTLNGAGSSDPDGDALSYLWTGSFGAVSGSQPSLGLGKGTHVITLTVSDGSFSDSDTVTITVVDDTTPELAISLDQTSLWPANHKYVTTNISSRATDNCDAEIGSKVQLVSVTSDETEDMQESGNKKDGGDGNTSADIVIVDNNSVKIRAERSGGGDGRVYTLNYNVTDASGNTTTASATAVVPHSPKKTVVDSGVKYTVRP